MSAAAPRDASAISDVFIFGDSIVDVGNTRGTALFFGFPDPAPPSLGYLAGRFTNGPNLADQINLAVEGTLSTQSGGSSAGDNFSFGGARADSTASFPAPLAPQVGAYLTREANVADPNALYFIHIGGNDVRDIVINSLDPTTIIANAVSAITTAVSDLSAAGATKFLVTGVADVGAIPEMLARSASDQVLATQSSADFNTALFPELDTLEGMLGIDIT